MLKQNIYITFLLFVVKIIPAQVNLVPNPSFEDTLQCPFNPAQITFAPPWYDATNASSDYYNNCNGGSYGVPTNIAGFQFARTGKAYAGIYTYIPGFNYRENLQVQLLSNLSANKNYCVDFYISLADTFKIAVNNIGAYFSDTAISGISGQVLNVVPQVSNDISINILDDKIKWIKVTGSFIANGNEKFITIGNFNSDITTDTIQVMGGGYSSAYYYIDDVSVICCDCNDTILVSNVFTPNNDGINDYFEIKNLPANTTTRIFNRWGLKVFETNKSNIFWDGRTTSGNESVDGTYFYIITTEEKTYKGYLQLIH